MPSEVLVFPLSAFQNESFFVGILPSFISLSSFFFPHPLLSSLSSWKMDGPDSEGFVVAFTDAGQVKKYTADTPRA